MGRKKQISDLNAAVHVDAEKYNELDLQPGMNPSGLSLECGNIETMEDLLVAATAHWFSGRLGRQFHEVVYAPNRHVERACGFDLSVAPLNTTKFRLRIQNKAATTWCDEAKTIPLPARERTGANKYMTGPERLFDQVGRLCSLYHASNGLSLPYLLVQQCYCLHDYRRMGRKDLDVPVPPIEDKFRSMAIEFTKPEFLAVFHQCDKWELQLAVDPAKSSVSCKAVMSDQTPIDLEVRTLEYLAGLLEEKKPK
jgi:hypothetical protein